MIMDYAYVYQMTDPVTNEFYIGLRQSWEPSDLDLNFLGDQKWLKLNRAYQVKTILHYFPYGEETNHINKEYKLQLTAAMKDPKCKNEVEIKVKIEAEPKVKRTDVKLSNKLLAETIKKLTVNTNK